MRRHAEKCYQLVHFSVCVNVICTLWVVLMLTIAVILQWWLMVVIVNRFIYVGFAVTRVGPTPRLLWTYKCWYKPTRWPFSGKRNNKQHLNRNSFHSGMICDEHATFPPDHVVYAKVLICFWLRSRGETDLEMRNENYCAPYSPRTFRPFVKDFINFVCQTVIIHYYYSISFVLPSAGIAIVDEPPVNGDWIQTN